MTQPAPDGNLPAALCRLTNAVAALTDPQPHTLKTVLHFTDSRYQQLRQAVAGGSGEHSGGPNRLPIWTDAFDLLIEINNTVNDWYPAPATNYEYLYGTRYPGDTRPLAVRQFAALAHRKWRPQDARTVEEHSGDIEAWVRRIDGLLADDHHDLHLTAPCPNCDTATVHRNNGGEQVRMAALHIDALGCHCLECGTRWAPEYFLHLARVIGCPAPAGILE